MFKDSCKSLNLNIDVLPDVCNADYYKGNEVLDQAKHVLVPETKNMCNLFKNKCSRFFLTT